MRLFFLRELWLSKRVADIGMWIILVIALLITKQRRKEIL